MKALFEIESVIEIMQKGVVLARELTPTEWALGFTATLNNIPIERYGDMPRALDKDGKQRLDLFAFILKDKSDKNKFSVGEIVELSP